MKNFKNIILGAAAVLAAVTVLAGCGKQERSFVNTADSSPPAGTILLSVNPELEIEYDERGYVIEIEGVNEDGREIEKQLGNLTGKECAEAVRLIVREIYEKGYFNNTVAGNDRNIIIKIEEGSAYPGEEFISVLEAEVKAVVAEEGLTSTPVTVEKEDLDLEGFIGIDKAKEIALAQAGVPEADFDDRGCELDDGKYELEFTANGVEYDYEVDAVTGKVVDVDTENTQMPEPTAPVAPAEPAPVPAEAITLDEAKAIALAHFGLAEARFTDAELDGGKYELEFFADGVEYDVDIKAATGEVLKAEKETKIPADTTTTAPVAPAEPAPVPAEAVTLDGAKAIALAHFGLAEARFTDAELDEGKYELEFFADGVEYDVDIKAATGEVLKAEKETKRPADTTTAPVAPAEPAPVPAEAVTLDEAKAIALAHFGLAEARFTDAELDEGKYELEFFADGVEYDIEISAKDGKVLDSDIERDD